MPTNPGYHVPRNQVTRYIYHVEKPHDSIASTNVTACFDNFYCPYEASSLVHFRSTPVHSPTTVNAAVFP
ncbi:MAG: hypothetical protein IPI53_06600 [Saprospiraceae bacterium]|nr:hypothetical protein [Saprospiraceae bacterium]